MLKKTVLRKNSEFTSLYNKGKSAGDKYVVVFYKKNDLGFNRTGFLASKKVGNSVARNRARRIMKEAYRALSDSLPVSYDFVILARTTISGKKMGDVKASLASAFKKADVLK